ncbi:major facilitator superfamily transporter [Microdochium trichocladiopsis]|uniref:Major facilitator superfamily transporter n=1 Tax=Microdochium trichocladiopsis TaxID=1682393 RepID=A0A9P8XVR5_9PEZI|nr:major facilitator superfamily transporter [Microdochium trichocladiopsis]KAH7020842.1 major facilitator superfamily transporter [Microdochium trichocladiopsis]
MSEAPKTTVRAWLALAGGAVALFCTVGFLNAFGVFQEYYSTYLPGRSPSDISWIGSLSIFLLYSISPLGGTLVDKMGPTIPLCVGSVGLVLSLFMTSLCTQYWQLILAQALLLGISASLVFCPPLGVVMRHMPHRRGLAMGLTVGGSSIGGIIWPIMLQQLLNKDGVSFGWTIRAIAFTMIPLLAFACVFVREPSRKPPAAPATTIAVIEKTAGQAATTDEPAEAGSSTDESPSQKHVESRTAFLRKPAYMLLCAGLSLTCLGLFTPLFYISKYAIAEGQPTSTAFYLLAAVNAASLFGRLVPGYLADTLGHFNLLIISTLSSGLVGFVWTKATTLAGLIVWSMAYGFTSGAVMSLQGACAGKLAPPQAQGIAVGVMMGFLSISSLIGTPISGQILSRAGYLALSAWTGATLLAGGAVTGAARFTVHRELLARY